MRHRSRLVLTALSATIVLGALVTAASANRLAASNWTLRATWRNFEVTEPGGNTLLRCPVTMEGSFHSRTLSKNLGQLIGYVTAESVGACTGGSAWVLTTNLPWHFRYNGFTATEGLPRIQGIKVTLILDEVLLQIREIFGQWFRCLYRASVASPLRGTVERNTTTGEATALVPEAARMPLWSEALSEAPCPAFGIPGGASTSLTVQGASTKITVTLVQ